MRIRAVDAIAQQAAAGRVRFFFAVDLLTVGEMIGTVGYTKSTSATGDCGWFLRKQFWGHGYASEAVRHLVELARADDQLERLTASCRLKNVASVRVAEACGFKRSAASDERVTLNSPPRIAQTETCSSSCQSRCTSGLLAACEQARRSQVLSSQHIPVTRLGDRRRYRLCLSKGARSSS